MSTQQVRPDPELTKVGADPRAMSWVHKVYKQFDTRTCASRRGSRALSYLILAARKESESPWTCWFDVEEALKCVRDLRKSISPKALDRMFEIVEQQRVAALKVRDEFLDRQRGKDCHVDPA